MIDSNSTTTNNTPSEIAELSAKLKSSSEKIQLQLIDTLATNGDMGLTILTEFMQERLGKKPTPVEGKIYQILTKSNFAPGLSFLQQHFPLGVVENLSNSNVDYSPLQQLLIKQEYQEADKLTIKKMCELAGPTALQRQWLYFTEVDRLPITDMQTINTLWLTYSEGKFGFSVQREIWLAVGKNWGKLWPKINWKDGNNWTRYPQEFTWDLTAPRGHLPLSNQLRGVRVINAILSHPAWTT